MELICEKGIGKTHAKWSPVATAYYRLVPEITIKEKIVGEEAKELKNICPMGVFDIEDLGKKSGGIKAVVSDSRKCTTCRECVRHDKFKDKIEIAKIKDKFEFHVESVGMYAPQDIVIEAFKKLKEKANFWIDVLD
jgi:DNA-directed RNA polymerases I and III subunit RPAC1